MLSMFVISNATQVIWTDLENASQAQGTAWDVIARTGDSNSAATASFSHDGKTILYTSATSVNSGMNTSDGLIYTVPYNNRAGGTAAALSGASDPSYVQFYPVFSADDAWVAFDRVPTGVSNPNGDISYNDPNAEVFVVPSSGGTATRLAANDPPACMSVKSPGVTNSWPKWSPDVKTVGGLSYYFLVFSSTRDPGASGGPQLYVAPITIDSSNTITSYSALYFRNQPETERNHTPAWDVFQLPGPN